jgi:DNA mismatch repair protein MutL
MIIIDKHAAHERIIYEKLKRENGERSPQILLLPVTVTLSKDEYSAMLENIDLVNKAGFEAEDFGNGCIIVRECPMELSADDVEEVIVEIAGRFVEKKQDVSFEKMDWIFHSSDP